MAKGLSDSQLNTQNALTQQQQQLAQQEFQQSQQQYQQAQTLEQPAINKYTALASGDPKAATAAAAPELASLTQGYNAAKANIMNTMPPGAARDRALADLSTSQYTGIAGTIGKESQQAPDILANIGAGLGAFSLQQVGAALSGFSGASSSNQAAMSAENQAKANQVGLVSGLAGAAGSAVSGTKLWGSDMRLKTNVRPLHSILDRACRFNIVLFDYKDGEPNRIGTIAQEVEQQFPQAVSLRPDGMKQVDYSMIAAIAVGMSQELSKRVRDLERRLESVEQDARSARVM